MKRFPASLVSATPVVPSLASAAGVWSREQQIQAQQQGLWPVNPDLADPYFEYVSMLLHGNGTDGAQNNTFIDSSANNFTITRAGNTTQGSFSPYGTLWSNYFDGTGDYLIPAANAAFALSTGDFTIEGWFFPASASAAQGILGCGPAATNSWQVFVNLTAGRVTFNVYGGTAYVSSNSFTVNTWNHFAVVRSSGTIKVYLNGIGNTGAANSVNFTVTDLVVGRTYYNLSQEHFQGNISNVRIVKSAVYTADFTPPSNPLTAISNTVLLTCQSNRFVDNSTTAATITRNGDVTVSRFSPFNPSVPYATSTIGGSGYFDGNLDYLTSASNAAFGFGSGDFTIEAWVYLTGSGATNGYTLFDLRNGVSTEVKPSVFVSSSGVLTYWTYASAKITGGALPIFQWAHVAVSRSSGSTRMFINGVQTGSTYSDFTDYGSTGRLVVGNVGDNPSGYNASWLGYVSNFRVLKGTGLYTTSFTPPSTPLTAITNTSVLLSTINGAVFDNAMMNDLQTVGTAQISTVQSKFGGGSILFQGSGNRLATPPNQSQLAFGAGDFTVEAWVYRTVSANGTILCGQGDGASVAGSSYAFYVSASATSDLYVGSGSYAVTSPNPSINQWAHVAFVRYGTSYKSYLNGTQVGSTTLAAGAVVNVGSATYPPTIGTTGTNANTLVGYIDELRVTKGYARYTANFTPPTAPFSNQ